ncbi:MAG TPA: ABC transporter ATP-binding protein [Acetobacteraceae bacterium]|nr:ABC transporter ATP-binding protein [Acetobacteraceae bacterium]
MVRTTLPYGAPPDRDYCPSAAAAPPAISLQEVTKHFYKRGTRITALSNVSLHVARGAFVAIVGPSGCGKSTILDLIVGTEKPSAGTIHCGTERVEHLRVGTGYLTQHDTLLPWRSVEQNVRLPLDIAAHGLDRLRGRRTDAAAEERVAWAINLVGLKGFEHHLPEELSGGMRKRAALAQTLVYAGETVLMDEPFGALDFQMRLLMQAELLQIWSTERRTIVFVTHDIEEAIVLSDQVVIMSRRPGRIRDIVPIDLPRPRDPVTARFIPRFRELYQRIWDQLDPPENARPRAPPNAAPPAAGAGQ